MPATRTIPDSFAAFARGKSLREIRKEYGIGWETTRAWLKAVGLESQTRPDRPELKRPMPEDFPTLAADRTNNWLRRHFRASAPAIARWRAQCGVAEPVYVRPSTKRIMPDGFRAAATGKTVQQLMKQFAASGDVVRRWQREAGLPVISSRNAYALKPSTTPAADASVAGRAAQHLRRFHASVHRADILPLKERKALPNGGRHSFFVSGKGFMSTDDLIALAERNGFDPQSWARI